MPSATARDKALKLARRRKGVTARELVATGTHRQVLSRLVEAGELERIARGLYRLPEHPPTENYGLVIAAAAVPQGVVCLISALQFHGIGTQTMQGRVEVVPLSVLPDIAISPNSFPYPH